MRHRLILGAIISLTSLAGCSTVPTVERSHTTMTRAEIEEAGLICRREKPMDTHIKRTICASEQAWAAFDDKRRIETDELLGDIRSRPNAGRFRRD